MPHPVRTTVTTAAVMLLLAACSGQPAPAGDTEQNAEAPSAIALETLSSDDIRSAALGGELGCSFAEPQASPLLVAMGFVASKTASNGAIKVGGRVEPVHAADGFDGMIKGATFTGGDHTVVVAVTGPAEGGGESPPNPATLTYQRANGASHTLTGRWVCGP